MKKLRVLLCMGVFAVVGCGGPTMEIESETTTEGNPTSGMSSDGSQVAASACTTTAGACMVGPCELGANDHFQRVTVVCCDAAGTCTTTRYKICGC